MYFSGLTFIFVFLPILLVVYYIADKRFKNIIFLLSSIVFYMWNGPSFLILLLSSILINYLMGLAMDYFEDKKKPQKAVLIITVILNLAPLFYYKYYNFTMESLNTFFKFNFKAETIVLPLAISFFTFQSLSYIIDLYRGKVKVQKNILHLMLFVMMFPTLLSGPIVRYIDIEKQLLNREVTSEKFSLGIRRFVIGLTKKVIIATAFGTIVDEIFKGSPANLSLATAWIGGIAYSLQIYFDFSGYSDMAIGVGKMFGFDYKENFNHPYISKSITEFWRRWHISLGTWFREYVYISLGGNRTGNLKLVRNILIVWALTGVWHGANWNFIIWGTYFGVLLLLEKFIISKILKKLPVAVSHIYALIFIIIGWVIFRAEDLVFIKTYLIKMFDFTSGNIIDNQAMFYITTYKLEFIIGIIFSMPVLTFINGKLKNNSLKNITYYGEPIVMISLFVLCLMYVMNSNFTPFIYFKF
ncbi:MAG: MBOAT family protein [Clostridiaceae bacterium]